MIADSAQPASQDELRADRRFAARLSMGIGLLMLLGKASAYFITGSAAILSDALESVVHVAATGMALFSVTLSAKPADRSHPYGHGKVEFFSAGIEGGLIVVAAIAIYVEVIRGLIEGRVLQSLNLGVIVIGAASAINLLLGAYLIHIGRTRRSLTLVANGKHVLTDSYTSIGVFVGVLLVKWTGLQWFDPLVAVAVATNIVWTGWRLMRHSVAGLMDEADEDALAKVANRLQVDRRPGWIDVHRLRLFKSGETHHIDFHMTVPRYWDIAQGHDTEEHVEAAVKDAFEGFAEVIVHLDPCMPNCCSSCSVSPCPVREAPAGGQTLWTVEHVAKPADYMQ